MKSLLAVLSILFATALAAQTPVDAQSQQGYSSPDDALYAALTVPGTYDVSAVLPVQTFTIFGPKVTWNVVRQATDTECSEPSHDQPWPEGWVWTAPACGHGLNYLQTMTFADLPTLRTWALLNLTAQQRSTMLVHQAVGTQQVGNRWWLIYQAYTSFCA